MQLRCGPHRDIIPFFVRPQVAKPQAKVCYLAAHLHLSGLHQLLARRSMSRSASASPTGRRAANNPDDHKDYGLATYNYHRDGSGVAFSSHLRPLADLAARLPVVQRRGGLGPASSAGRHASHGLARSPGHRLRRHHRPRPRTTKAWRSCRSYNVVLTGSHPEYHTDRTLDALQTYTETGGRLMYLGGNGFYWRSRCRQGAGRH